jgi:WD40 repeat protein
LIHTRTLAIALLLSLTSGPLSAQKPAESSVELIATLSGHTKNIEAIEFSHDGERVATSSNDKTVRVWRVATSECLATIVGDGAAPYKLNWSLDDRRLAITYTAKRQKWSWDVVVWEVPSGLPPIVGHRFQDAYFQDWSPDNRLFLALDHKEKPNIWDAVSGQLTQTLNPQPSTNIASFVADGQRIVTASSTEPVQLWDVATGKLVHTYSVSVPEIEGNHPLVNQPWLSPDKRLLLSANVKYDPQRKRSHTHLTMLKVESGEELLTFELPKDVHYIFWAPDGKTLAVNSYDSKPRLIDATTGREIGRLPLDNCWPWTMCGSDGCERLTFNADGTVLLKEKEALKLWDTKTVSLIAQLKDAHLPAVFSPTDSRLLATRSGNKKSVLLWRLKR